MRGLKINEEEIVVLAAFFCFATQIFSVLLLDQAPRGRKTDPIRRRMSR